MNPKKSPGYELITNRILQMLPKNGIIFITQIFNAVYKYGFFLPQWKVTQSIMIKKPGKTAGDVVSYKPISLLCSIKVICCYRSCCYKLMPIIEECKLIPNHQFGFRRKYVTIDQIRRIFKKLTTRWKRIGIAGLSSLTSRRRLTKCGMMAFCTKLSKGDQLIFMLY